MVKLCQKDNSVVGITAAMPSGTGLKHLEKAMPHRYYDVGIAEEHAVMFAAGMATMGFHPVCAIYSTFLQRAYDCIIHDVALQDLPVIFCMDRAGLVRQRRPDASRPVRHRLSALRAEHHRHGAEGRGRTGGHDVHRHAPNIRRSSAIRAARPKACRSKTSPRLLEIGKAEVIQNFSNNGGRKVAFFALGNLQRIAKKAAEQLAAEGCDMRRHQSALHQAAGRGATEFFGRAADVVVTLEDHVLTGGYGSTVLELFSEKRITTPVVRIGWPDQFIEHASTVDYLREKYGLTLAR